MFNRSFIYFRTLKINRNINKHRPETTSHHNIVRFFKFIHNHIHIFYKYRILSECFNNCCDVSFLETFLSHLIILLKVFGMNLTNNKHRRNRIKVTTSNCSNKISCPWPTCCNRYTKILPFTCISFCSKSSCLFMVHRNTYHPLLFTYSILKIGNHSSC